MVSAYEKRHGQMVVTLCLFKRKCFIRHFQNLTPTRMKKSPDFESIFLIMLQKPYS